MKLSLLLLVTFVCLNGSSQSYVGYGYDNYSGVNGMVLNPGSIADSKFKVHVNILSVSLLAGNNAYELDRKKLFGLHLSDLHEGDGYYKSTKNTGFKYVYTNVDILGPSAMVNLNSKNAIGITTRFRTVGNEYNLSDGLFQLFGQGNPAFNNIDIQDRSLQTKVHSFAEAGLSYGRVLKKDKHSLIKAGVTVKYISGRAFASLSSGQMLVNIDPANNIAKLNADVTAQYSGNLDNFSSGNFSDAFKKEAGHGWGLDLGLVYEWRPESMANDETPYKLRMGLSLTDIGNVNYTNSPNSQTYAMNAVGHNTAELAFQNGETNDQYLTRLKNDGIIVSKATGASSVKVSLPTAVHVNADYHVYKRIFVDGDILLNMVSTTNLLSPNYITSFTVTPRLEKKWVSIYSPVSYNVQSQLTWGAGVRFGPLFVGSGSVLSNMLRNRIQAADVHVGLTVPIFQASRKKKQDTDTIPHKGKVDTIYKQVIVTHDRDGDGVVDEKDECPDSAGPIALIGCPDKDGDGVPNYKDKCPNVAGSPKYQGCPIPDTDGDGVNDDEDKCPLVKGVASNRGCPPIRKEVIEKVDVYARRVFFVRAKDIIERNSYRELDGVVAVLKADTTLHLHIEGHTDTEGTDERNQSLSERRARSVKHYLESKGIADGRMDYKGYGSKRPMATNNTAEGMALNRRVELKLTNW